MSKEEQVIHMLKSYAGMTHKLTDNQGRPKLDQAIETVLNLLEKKQTEINFLKEEKETAWQEWNDMNEYCNQEKEQHKAELEKKDKVINEMANALYDYANLGVLIKCPAEYNGRYYMDLCKMNLVDRNCLVCIKEYFERKVEEK